MRAILLLCLLAGSASLARAECQGPPPVFGQNLVAIDKDTLSWAVPADVDFVKGPLSHMGLYATWGRGSLLNATSLDISNDIASPGQGIYYLLKPSDPCGSWQSTVGAEPQRDLQIHMTCTERDPTDAEIDSAVSAALVGLSDPWGVEAQFIVLFDRIQDNLGCALEIPPPAAAVADGPDAPAAADPCVINPCDAFYCGPTNTSKNWFGAAIAGPCLNAACFIHDQCSYLACVSFKPSCYFSPQSRGTGCDAPLVDACRDCPAIDRDVFHGAWFLDKVICKISEYLAATPRGDSSCNHPPCDNTDANCMVETCDPQHPNASPNTGCRTTTTVEPDNINGNCNDTFSCTSPDFCTNGVCAGTRDDERCPENSSTDADADCYRDRCNPLSVARDDVTGCVENANLEPSNVPGNCVDPYFCTLPDFCSNGECIGTSLSDRCPDNSTTDGDADCRRDQCNPNGVGRDPSTGCVTDTLLEPNSVAGNCVDPYSCTSPDFCQAGACTGAGDHDRCPDNFSTDGDADCRRDACSPTSPGANPTTGCLADAINEPNNVDGNCIDSYFCTSPDYCLGGVCNGINQNSLCGEVPGDCVSNLCSPGTAGTDIFGCIALCNLTVCGPGLQGHCSGCVCGP